MIDISIDILKPVLFLFLAGIGIFVLLLGLPYLIKRMIQDIREQREQRAIDAITALIRRKNE